MSFENFNLANPLMKAIVEHNYDKPTQIQSSVIPIILEGQDLMASAETGAGKTVAFILPTLQRLLLPSAIEGGRGPRALILTPTRELADQLNKVITKMAKFTALKMGSITGGVPYFAQENLLRKPLDLLVATPGRLLDHMQKNRVDFSRIELFILDEADRMLDMGFMKDIETIFNELPSERQILLFSATLEGEVHRIAKRFLNNPQQVQLTSREKPNTSITQKVHQVNNLQHKRAVLSHILSDANVWQAIVFTATKRAASELAYDLSETNIPCGELHGDMKQSKRTRTIENLRQGRIRVLVATDVAARGLDVKNLSHVINYDLPKSGEDYIHRIGRTGRAGEKGTAISLVSPRDSRLLSQIERFIGRRLERINFTNSELENNALSALENVAPRESNREVNDRRGMKDRREMNDRNFRDDRNERNDRGDRSDRDNRKGRDFRGDRNDRDNRKGRNGGRDGRNDRKSGEVKSDRKDRKYNNDRNENNKNYRQNDRKDFRRDERVERVRGDERDNRVNKERNRDNTERNTDNRGNKRNYKEGFRNKDRIDNRRTEDSGDNGRNYRRNDRKEFGNEDRKESRRSYKKDFSKDDNTADRRNYKKDFKNDRNDRKGNYRNDNDRNDRNDRKPNDRRSSKRDFSENRNSDNRKHFKNDSSSDNKKYYKNKSSEESRYDKNKNSEGKRKRFSDDKKAQ